MGKKRGKQRGVCVCLGGGGLKHSVMMQGKGGVESDTK